MKVKIEIKCDNAAFDGDDCGYEISKIARIATDGLNGCNRENLKGYEKTLKDSNGNTVGQIKITR
jgi:hypothetical protein